MPNIDHLYATQTRRRIGFLALAVILTMASLSTALLTAPQSAHALGSTGPDPADFQGNNMTFVVDNSSYVYTPNTSFRMYFKTKTGNQVVVHSPGLHDSVEYEGTDTYDQIYSPGFPGNPDVTQYFIRDTAGNDLVASQTAQAADNANMTFTFNFPAAAVPDANTGYYVAVMYAHMIPAMPNDVHNGFAVTVNNGGIVGFDSKNTADVFGIQEKINPRDYADWRLKFGADCTVLPPSGLEVPFKWYDPDNGNSGIQPNKMSFEIWDYTATPKLVHIDSHSGTDFTSGGATIGPSGYKVTPGGANVSRTNGQVDFRALPNHIYQIIFTGVYSNNTLQFQLPFDSIYYTTHGCQSWQLTPTLGAPANNSVLTAGATYSITPGAENLSTSLSGAYTEQMAKPSDSTGGVTFASTTAPSGGPWAQAALASGASRTIPGVTMSIPITAPSGSRFCIESMVTPANASGASAVSTQYCYTVQHIYQPAIVGFNGDIHAGGSKCSGGVSASCSSCPAAVGAVNGNGGSYGQYVVSATGGISSFGSNASPINVAASLGVYNTVCRPDLVAKAASYMSANGIGGLAGGTHSIAQLAASADASGVAYVRGDLHIPATNATLAKNLSVYVTGTVYIDGSVALNRSGTGKTIPGFGIIAGGGINVAAVAHQVDAYLFSNANINTCYVPGVNPSTTYTSQCANTLTVNGFLMANSISFYRYGVPSSCSSSGCPMNAEVVTLSPQLYTNPPELFEGGQDQSLLNDLGERPPLN